MKLNIQPMPLLLILLGVFLPACSSTNSPATVIEEYVEAMVQKDVIQTVNLSCAAWEQDANAEGAAFEGVEVSLQGVSCSVLDEDGDIASVACTGKFVFQYAAGEIEEIGLDRRDYSLVKENDEWKMCGYQ